MRANILVGVTGALESRELSIHQLRREDLRSQASCAARIPSVEGRERSPGTPARLLQDNQMLSERQIKRRRRLWLD